MKPLCDSYWKEDKRTMRYSWAPGNYAHRCPSCMDNFFGDKLAQICADCAYALPDPTPESPKEEIPQRFIDPTARLGENVKVWHFSVVLAQVAIGDNVSIGSHCEIGRGSIIGKGTRIGNGVFLPSNSLIGENVFIGPSTTFTDDKKPVVNNPDYDAKPPVIHDHVSIGAGCVILPGVTIYSGAMIGAGSVVTKDVPSNSLVYGDRAVERMRKECEP